jgi:hypothetical protein
MRARFLMLSLFLAGAAIAVGATTAYAAETAIGCDTFVTPGSDLAGLLESLSPAPACTREVQENIYVERLRARGVARETEGAAFQLELQIFRSNFEWDLMMPSRAGERELLKNWPLRLSDTKAYAHIRRYEKTDTNVTFACAWAYPEKSDNFMFEVEMCRPVKAGATDAEILIAAQEMAERYMTSIKP